MQMTAEQEGKRRDEESREQSDHAPHKVQLNYEGPHAKTTHEKKVVKRRGCEGGGGEEEEEAHTGKSLEVEPVEEAIQAIHCLCLT